MIMRTPDPDSDEPIEQPEKTPYTHYITTEQELVDLFLFFTSKDEDYIRRMVKKLLQNPKSGI